MSNIVKFPQQPQEQNGIQDDDSMEGEYQPRSKLGRVLAWLWAVVRLPLFLVLYWLRGPVLMMFNLLGSLASLCFVFGLLFFREKQSILWSLGGMSFAAFALRWAYDSLLLWLSPEEIILY